MRRLLLVLVVSLAGLAPAASSQAASLYVVQGAGWGHGVGMSQWGAYGMASTGVLYRDILTHYYRGTTVSTRSSVAVRVLLSSGRNSVRIGADAAFAVGTRTHAAGNPLVWRTSSGRIAVEGFSRTFASPVTFSPGSAPLRLNGSRYRGKLVVSVASGLRVVNRLGLEKYVKGVVPRESPSWFPSEALKAQAVAARSYTLATTGKCGSGVFCPDTRDQVYGGIGAETSETNAAVAATAGEVVDYEGTVAQTFFHSSSGGRTAASADVWSARPYLQSVPDDADLNAANPHRSWRVVLSARALGRRLGPRKPEDATVARDGSDRVKSITLSGAAWSTTVPGGDSIRWRLGVKSSRFWIGVLRLRASASTITWGQDVRLDMLVRDVAGTTLQQKPYGGAWTNVTPISGSVSLVVTPKPQTNYRLASPSATGSLARVYVAAAIGFALEQPAGALTGSVKPKGRLAGETVVLHRRRSDGTWRHVGTAVVAEDGTWRVALTVRAGLYRARITPPSSTGLLRGTAKLTVTTG